MACERSPIRAPGRAAAMPAARARWVDLDQLDRLRGPALADDEADRGVRGDAVEANGEVEGQQVAVGKPLVARTAVEDGVVDRGAHVVAERAAPEGRGVVDVAGLRTGGRDHLGGPAVEVEQVGADLAAGAQRLEDVGHERTRAAGPVDLDWSEDLDHRRPHRTQRFAVVPAQRSSSVIAPSPTSTDVRVSIVTSTSS